VARVRREAGDQPPPGAHTCPGLGLRLERVQALYEQLAVDERDVLFEQPIDEGKTDDAYKRNRRIEFKLTER